MVDQSRPAGAAIQPELSGDIPLSAADRLRFLWRNACRNVAAVGRGPATQPFHPDRQRAFDAIAGQSPGRWLTEVFIATELPRLMPPRQIEVLEIGCGSGSMAPRLAGIGYSGHYTGVDIQDRFRREQFAGIPFTFDHLLMDAHALAPARPADLLISVSALEHIPNDRDLIRRFPQFVRAGGLELHMVPSGPGLATYLWHGYRQYTPAALAERFGGGVGIVRIGGFGSFLLHLFFITVPEMLLRRSLRRAAPGLYRSLLRAAWRVDRVLPVLPTAYAVVRRH